MTNHFHQLWSDVNGRQEMDTESVQSGIRKPPHFCLVDSLLCSTHVPVMPSKEPVYAHVLTGCAAPAELILEENMNTVNLARRALHSPILVT